MEKVFSLIFYGPMVSTYSYGRRPNGLAMCSSGRRPDPAGAARAGPSEQRAAKRSADERSEAEAPKQQRALKRQQAL